MTGVFKETTAAGAEWQAERPPEVHQKVNGSTPRKMESQGEDLI